MEILAIIPAKKNSKGLPNKNIKNLNGHPLLAYSVAAAIQNKFINRVICSTDSTKIARIAKKYGAEIPFIRPKKYSTLFSSDLDFFKHALNWLLINENYIPDLIVHLRPTSPLRFQKHINQGLRKIILNKSADSLRAVSFPSITPYKMWKFNKKGFMSPLLRFKNNKEPFNLPRQKLPKTYVQTGYLDIIRYSTLIKQNSLSGKKILPLFVPEETIIDIDNINVFNLAKIALKKHKCIKP